MKIVFRRNAKIIGSEIEVASSKFTLSVIEVGGKVVTSRLYTADLEADLWYVLVNHILWTVKEMIQKDLFYIEMNY